MQKKERYWPDSSVRAKRWRANQGKAVLTYLHPSMVKALHEEAKRKNKAVWKLVQTCISYGFSRGVGSRISPRSLIDLYSCSTKFEADRLVVIRFGRFATWKHFLKHGHGGQL